ncbi:MAG: DNA polymerase III subunit alpha [Pseudomonadota bacterium]|nr:DNA polymerase III subunit alpha [Pseudomonadota bacterium]
MRKNRQQFVHLRVHSSYSLLEGAITPKLLKTLCAENQMPAVAVTDTGNMFGALEISQLLSETGIQPIIGCQLSLVNGLEDSNKSRLGSIVLLAKDKMGYDNLIKLSSKNFLDCGRDEPHLTFRDIENHREGLICLSGGVEGPVGQTVLHKRKGKDEELVDWFIDTFGDRFYLEIQRHPSGSKGGTPDEIITEPRFLELAYEKHVPIVATNDVHFADTQMYEAHDAMLCISEGAYIDQKAPRRKLTSEHYFKSQDQMIQLFSDLPEAISNSVEIAQRCSVMSELREPILPKFADNEIEELKRQSYEGLHKRLAEIQHSTTTEKYFERLDFELGVIDRMGYPGYFLIVADFIKWAKSKGIPVGPGRGSGAGSLVAFSLTITDLDPIRYSLLFERFLNPERVSMPDFDIDFCMDRREEVINYVQNKYGHDRVAQIITFGALLSKAAIRDIGRVLQVPYSYVDKLSKMVPLDGTRPLSIGEALMEEPRLAEEKNKNEIVGRLLDYAQKIEGLLRNAATHAAGVVIADRPLTDLVPLYRDPRSEMPATQFNMKWVEQSGLVKFDFLGLKTLTIVKNAVDLVRARNIDIDLNSISFEDKSTFDLYSSAKTVAVFQVESNGMREALAQLRPTCIEDIIALVALYRPGPIENIPKFCAVKNGKEEREYIHPLIDSILDETQGIIVYQEQVMEIARKMAGYTLGGADLLRKAMGKKIKEAMDAEKPKFLSGAAERDVDKRTASKVWDLLEKFANYGFNKSHAAAYAVLSYQTAWLKANYPVEFMAAVMNCDIHFTEKLNVYKQEIESLNLELKAPCINLSVPYFSVLDLKIIYGLAAVKNVGSTAMQYIVDVRSEGGLFKDIFDFARRVDLKRIGRRQLETLIKAGAFDALSDNRKMLFMSIDKLIAYSAAVLSDRQSGQSNLFSSLTEAIPNPKLEILDDWPTAERLGEEYQAIGFYLSGHPVDEYREYFEENGISIFSQLERERVKSEPVVRIVGVVTGKQERQSSRGNRYAFVQFSDPSGLFECTVFSETLEKNRDAFSVGNPLILVCEVSFDGEQAKLLLKSCQPLSRMSVSSTFRRVRIYVEKKEALKPLKEQLTILNTLDTTERVPISLVVINRDAPSEVEVNLSDEYPLNPEALAAIKHISGIMKVERV